MASRPTVRDAEVVVKDLAASDFKTTYKELAAAFGLDKVAATTPITGADRTIKTKVAQYRKAQEAQAKSSSSDDSTPAKGKPRGGKSKATKKGRRNSKAALITSNRPPRIRRTTDGVVAAAELMRYLQQFEIPKTYPLNFEKFRRHGVAMVRGTTVDGEVIEITQTEAIENLARRNDLSYAIPLFSPNVEKRIVTFVSKLDGAPALDATDENNLRLYPNRTAWFYNLLQVGIRIWSKNENPPSLDLKEFPDREFQEDGTTKVRTVTFRYRSVVIGFVARIKEAFENAVLESNLTGSRLREFRDQWLDDFISGKIKVVSGPQGSEQSFRDFRIDGKQGSREEFMTIWSLVERRERQMRRSSSRSRGK